jgi:sulfatase modifying factor 1
MSETEEPESPKRGRKPVKPLPRLWKTESESDEGGAPSDGSSRDPKKARNGDEKSAAKSSASAKPAKAQSKSAKAKAASGKGEPSEKKVLKEDTPTLDTYESRQRARIIMGTLGTLLAFLAVWIFYRAFLYDPGPMQVTNEDPTIAPAGPEPGLLPETEARYMLGKAREFDKNGRRDLAIAKLNDVVDKYKGTRTAAEAKAALERSEKDLPLFPDRPVVEAEAPPKKAPFKPPLPPPVVAVTPDQPRATDAQAKLVLPANPSEAVVIPPDSLVRTTPSASVTPRALPAGFQAKLDQGVHESGWPRVISSDRDGAPMMFVPGGTFTMGNNDEPVEAPAHSVRLSGYYIDQHEVTNRQFRIFLSESHYRGGKWLTDEKARAAGEMLPVVYVDFADAKAFADWAGKTIPTEAQWELAARSTDGRRYPWGYDPASWSRTRGFHQIDPVMTFAEDASPFGVFDMAGNAIEWTKDWFDPRYYKHIAKATTDNPAGAAKRTGSDQLVVKGGSKKWSVTHREAVPITNRLPYLGFRCVLMVETGAPAPVSGAPAPLTGAPPPLGGAPAASGGQPAMPAAPAGGQAKPPPVPV